MAWSRGYGTYRMSKQNDRLLYYAILRRQTAYPMHPLTCQIEERIPTCHFFE
jgi:hypothetical protein